jgi:tetratricopeptide (TPR) repeat protein
MNPMRTLLTVALLSLLPLGARAADPAAVVAAKRKLADAVNTSDPKSLQEARAAFVALSAAEPANADLHTWAALATWRVVPRLQDDDQKRALAIGEDGLAHCEQALKADPKHAMALGLKGALQGMLIGLKPAMMMAWGMESGANLRRAMELAPGEPRLKLLSAIGTFHTPVAFGGGAKKAMPEIDEAITLFERAATPDSTAPDWGREDAWTWKGVAHQRLGENTAARDAFRRALELNPSTAWVKHVLLPGIEAEIAKGGGS